METQGQENAGQGNNSCQCFSRELHKQTKPIDIGSGQTTEGI